MPSRALAREVDPGSGCTKVEDEVDKLLLLLWLSLRLIYCDTLILVVRGGCEFLSNEFEVELEVATLRESLCSATV